MLPSLVGVSIFVLLPFLSTVRMSFQTAVSKQFVGGRNYQLVCENQAFILAVKNTLRFVAVGIPVLLLVSLFFSLLLFRCRWVQQIKAALLFPLAVPTATVVLIWRLLFYRNGILNQGLSLFQIESIDWLGSDAAFYVLIISYVWKNLGYTVVLWLAGMKNIPTSLLEAVKVDGAGARKIFWYIMLPELKPVLYTITVLSFLNSFKIFREAYLVAGAYPQNKMYLLQHLFNNWFTNLDMDKMAAAAVMIAVLFALFVRLLDHLWEEESV